MSDNRHHIKVSLSGYAYNEGKKVPAIKELRGLLATKCQTPGLKWTKEVFDHLFSGEDVVHLVISSTQLKNIEKAPSIRDNLYVFQHFLIDTEVTYADAYSTAIYSEKLFLTDGYREELMQLDCDVRSHFIIVASWLTVGDEQDTIAVRLKEDHTSFSQQLDSIMDGIAYDDLSPVEKATYNRIVNQMELLRHIGPTKQF